MNRKALSTNKLGYKNIHLYNKKFRVKVKVYNRYPVIGIFDDLETAIIERNAILPYLHDEFYRLD